MANVFQNYNPYKEAKFKQSYTGDNQEIVLMKDGVPYATTDSKGISRILKGPAIFLKRKTLIEWFKSVYPDGSIDEELISYEESKVILKVSLYKNYQKTEFISSSHGIAMVKNHFYDVIREISAEGTETNADLYNLAFYLGLKQAMERSGFNLNYDPEFLMENVPGYKEACHTGDKTESGIPVIMTGGGTFKDPSKETLAEEKKLSELEKEIEDKTSKRSSKKKTEPKTEKRATAKSEAVEEVTEASPDEKKETGSVAAVEVSSEVESGLDSGLEGADPIQAFLASSGASEARATKPEKSESESAESEEVETETLEEVLEEEHEHILTTQTEPKVKEEELSLETSDDSNELGNAVFKVSELASMKLKAYDGELLKNLPKDFLEYVVSKDWKGKIEEEMLTTIREYLF